MTPKSLLRHKLAVSTLAEMANGSHFRTVIPEIDTLAPPDEVKRVVLCSGKVYYDLLAERREAPPTTSPSCALEQLYPFPVQVAAAGAGAVPQGGGRVVPGGAGEHGRLDLRRPAASRTAAQRPGRRRQAPRLCRAHRRREPGDRARQDPCRGTGGAGPLGADARLTSRTARPKTDQQIRNRTRPHGDRDQGAHAGRERHHRDRRALAEAGGRQRRRRRAAGRAGDRQGHRRGERAGRRRAGRDPGAGRRRGRSRRRAGAGDRRRRGRGQSLRSAPVAPAPAKPAPARPAANPPAGVNPPPPPSGPVARPAAPAEQRRCRPRPS